MKKRARNVLLCCASLAFYASFAFLQGSSRASQIADTGIELTVFDVSGAALPGIKVRVSNNEATVANAVTDQTGTCRLELAQGTYEISAYQRGFKEARWTVTVREHEIARSKSILEVDSTMSKDPIEGRVVKVPTQTSSLDGQVAEKTSDCALAPENSKNELLELENQWLWSLDDPAALEAILAPDFLHVVKQGIITREQQLGFLRKQPAPASHDLKHFENMHVRIYGNAGVVNGVVVATGNGRTQRTLFTDVFAYRDGKWQAVSAQELPEERH